MNGDGYDDVILGNPFFEVAPYISGTALVFLGGPSGIADGDPSSADARLESDEDPYQRATYFGWRVAGAGDVNGDGYDDVIVGAPEYASRRGETRRGLRATWAARPASRTAAPPRPPPGSSPVKRAAFSESAWREPAT